MKKVYGILTKISTGLAYVSYVAILIAVGITVVDVVMRKFFNSAVFGTYEIMEFLMCCTVFASFAYTQTKKGHIRVSMFIKKMPRKLGMTLYSINEFLCTFIAAVIAYAAYMQTGYSIKKHLVSANLFIPHYPFYILEMICMIIFTAVLLVDAIFAVIGIFKKEYADEIMDAI